MNGSNKGEHAPELWGGIECTVNRVGEVYFDQIRRSGHEDRIEDLDRIAGLGIRRMRYPVLWERVAPEAPGRCEWRWSDERLARLRELGVEPIVGLLHHGSGPRYTSLAAPEFPELFAQYARSVAQRYPWVTMYTPINEILTTARFSGLYGIWYPHGRDERTFATILLNECRATVLAMRAIREVQPRAQLVQTDDLGKIYSTTPLAYQANFENERRWVGYDLLCGKVTPDTVMWAYLTRAGAAEKDLAWFQDNACPPDIIGCNHYLTSERFLDHRTEHYPKHTIGGNGRHRYADVEAVRVMHEGIAGPEGLLREAWERYRLPIAVTEVHLGCTRGEQMRWLLEVWQAAKRLKREGVDLRAVTVWSMLGAYDWNSLLTRDNGFYEPGVFDARSNTPRATALAQMVKSLATAGECEHPVLETPGWWRRDTRLLYPAYRCGITRSGAIFAMPRSQRPVLITGGAGRLARALAASFKMRGIPHRLLTRADLDICNAEAVEEMVSQLRPWAVINAAGYVRVDDAEKERERCHCENVLGPVNLARACARHGARFVTFSSDLVFDGNRSAPYTESATPNPLNVYGATKAEAERAVLEAMPEALVVRTSAFFGPSDSCWWRQMLEQHARQGRELQAARDQVVSPTFVPDLATAAIDLMIDDTSGIWHLANNAEVSWYEFARMMAGALDLEVQVKGIDSSAQRCPAPRPAYTPLTSERGNVMPKLEEALDSFRAAVEAQQRRMASAV
jgi:dTDP-4-dehydrorhamnose reductase